MNSTILCPHCGNTMQPSDRFCPSCGIPRTHVRQELERASATTGIPYERLLGQARERDAKERASAPSAPPSIVTTRKRPDAQVALIVIGVLLVLAVIVGVGARLSGDGNEASSARPATKQSSLSDLQTASAIRSELASGFSGTSWHSLIDQLLVSGSIVDVRTEIFPDEEGKQFARDVCIGVSGTVFRNDRSSWGVSSVRVIAQDGTVLVHRQHPSDNCDP